MLGSAKQVALWAALLAAMVVGVSSGTCPTTGLIKDTFCSVKSGITWAKGVWKAPTTTLPGGFVGYLDCIGWESFRWQSLNGTADTDPGIKAWFTAQGCLEKPAAVNKNFIFCCTSTATHKTDQIWGVRGFTQNKGLFYNMIWVEGG